MKKLIIILAIFALVLTACLTDDDGGDDNGKDTGNTTLRIKNESSKPIRNVVWNNVVFNDDQNPINKGNSTVKTLQEGSGYIFFNFYAVPYRTNSLVVVEKDETAEFTFLDSTVVIEVSNPNNSVTLGSLATPPTTLSITNSTSYDFFTVEYGDIDFGSISKGSSISKTTSPGTKDLEVSVYFDGMMVIYMTVDEPVLCEEGMPKQFTITNTTNVTAASGAQGTLKNVVDTLTEAGKH